MEITTKQAVAQLIKALKEDPDYYYSWQANIAVDFQDEVGDFLPFETVHEMSNNAAKRFLDRLIYVSEVKNGGVV